MTPVVVPLSVARLSTTQRRSSRLFPKIVYTDSGDTAASSAIAAIVVAA